MRYDPNVGWVITIREWERLGYSKSLYKKLKNSGKLQTTTRPAPGTNVGIMVGSLPMQYRQVVEQRMVQLQTDHHSLMVEARMQGANLTQAAVQVTANTLLVNAQFIATELREAINRDHPQYVSHYLQGYRLSRSSVIGYAKLCAMARWIYGMAMMLRNRYASDKDYNRQLRSFRANLAEALQQLHDELEVKPPLSQRLDSWVNLIVEAMSSGKEVTDIIKPRRAGNSNGGKLGDEQKLAIERLYSDPAALSISEIYNKLVELGRLQGWWRNAAGSYMPPTYETIRRHIEASKNVLKVRRRGVADFRNNVVPTINRRYPESKNMAWGIDGTAQNEYVHHQGRVRQYAYAVVVFDYATFRLLNVHITLGLSETDENMIQAVRGAVMEAGYKPRVLQCDHGPAFNGLKKWCAEQGITVIPASLGVARAKPVELLIGLKDKLIDRFNASWSGGNRTALGENSHPGEEHVRRSQRNARDFSIARGSLAHEVMQQWNHYVIGTREGKPCGQTPTELWNQLPSHTPKLDPLQLAMVAGTKHTVKLTIDGLTVQNKGQKYLYFPALDTEADLELAYEVFAAIPRTGHRQGSQLDIYITDYGRPAPVFKDGRYYGTWQLKPRVDMFATITNNTAAYGKLKAFQQLFIERSVEQVGRIEEQYQTQEYAPMLDELMKEPLTGRKRVVPLLDKSALNADEIMAKSGEGHADPEDELYREIAAETKPGSESDEYEIRQYVHAYTGEIITHRKLKKPNQ